MTSRCLLAGFRWHSSRDGYPTTHRMVHERPVWAGVPAPVCKGLLQMNKYPDQSMDNPALPPGPSNVL